MRSWISQIRSNETLVTRLFYCRGQLVVSLFLPSMVPVFVHRSTWNMFWTKTDTTATLPFPQRIRSNLKSQEFQTAQSISTFLFEDMSWSVAYIFIRFIHFETAKKKQIFELEVSEIDKWNKLHDVSIFGAKSRWNQQKHWCHTRGSCQGCTQCQRLR